MNVFEYLLSRWRKAPQDTSPLYRLNPELAERVPILRITSDAQGTQGTLSDYQEAGTFYEKQAWVHKAVKILADNASPLPVRVVKGDERASDPLPQHPISALLANPNSETSPADLWRAWLTDMLLGGEHGLEMVKAGARYKELWNRQPGDFSVRPGELGKRYKRVAYYTVDDGEGDSYRLPPEEFVHFKFYNPLNIWRGLAPITAIRNSILIDQLAQAWSRLFFKNNARPDYAVIAPEGLTPSEREEIELKLMLRHGGENQHRPIVLEQGVSDIKTLSFQPKDMEWLAQREFARDEVAAIFGVPDELMGYGKDTYENFDTARRVLWTLTIIPVCSLRDDVLTRVFRRVNALKADERIETDYTNVPELREDVSAKIDQLNTLAGRGYPINLLDEWLGLGLGPVKGGEVGYLPTGMAPMGTPAPVSTPEPPTPVQARSVKGFKAPEYGSAEHKALWEGKQAKLDEPVAKMQRKLKKFFQDQQTEVLRKLRNGKQFGRGKWKGTKDAPPPDELFDTDYWTAEFKRRFRPEVLETFSAAALRELANLTTQDVPMLDPSAAAVDAVRRILETVAAKTTDTTWRNLVDLLTQAEADGLGIPAIQELLNTYFGGRKSDYETERIARTTMTGADNAGALEGWAQSGVVKEKSWLSALIADRTRDAHAEAHGQTVGLKESYTVGGESLDYPGDPKGDPSNIINCLCSQLPVVA